MLKYKDNLGNWVGIAELDENGKVPSENLPDDISISVGYGLQKNPTTKEVSVDTGAIATKAYAATVGPVTSVNGSTGAVTIAEPNNGTLTLQVGGNTQSTFTANSSSNATFNVTASDLGLSQALVFKGITTTNLTDGATTSPITLDDSSSLIPQIGYVVITASTVSSLPNTEFVWASSKWNKLGDAKSYALSSVKIEGTGALGGGGDLTTNRTITHNVGNAPNKTSGLYKFSTDAYSHINAATAVTKDDITGLDIPAQDTTYTFTGGTNQFTVTPSGGSAQTVTVTPSITNNITGSGTSGYIAKFNGTNTITNGPAIGSSTTTYLRNDGTWATPPDTDTKVTSAASTANANYPILINNGTTATTNTVLFKSTVNVNPSTGTLTADKVVGGVWNDYAEYRKCEFKEPGYVVCENGNGKLEASTKKLQACPYVISDTFGFAIGEKEDGVPVATGGRVLVHVCGNREDYKVGDVLCAGANGAATKMSRRQIRKYPDRILGIVCEIPSYDIWSDNDIKINNRIWIKVI